MQKPASVGEIGRRIIGGIQLKAVQAPSETTEHFARYLDRACSDYGFVTLTQMNQKCRSYPRSSSNNLMLLDERL
ncbi:MAG: hypothetical protein V7695_18845, partial [Sulfitobacter sp.]